MNLIIFLGIFLLFIGFYSLLAIQSSRSMSSSTTSYFSVGKNLGFWPITFSLIATQLGGGMLLGTSENAYSIGIYGILYTLGMAIGFLLLGLGFAAQLQTLEVATTAELFETRYHSKTLKTIASLCSILTLSGIFISQVVGSKSVIQALLMTSMTKEVLFIFFWLLIIIYTMLGGLKTVIVTDIFQVIFIIIVFGGIFIYQLIHEPSIFFTSTYLENVQKTYFSSSVLLSQFSLNTLVATLVMPALFSLIEQDLAQRFFSARSKKIAALSSLGASLFMISFSLIPIYLGMKARLLGIPIEQGTSPLIPIISYLSSDIVLSLAICAIIAAITSTANSLLCAISSNVAQDFDIPFFKSNHTLQSQIITLLIGIFGLISSYLVPQNIINLLIGSYQISVNCLLVPLITCLFTKHFKQQAAWFAVIGGAIASIITLFIPTTLPISLIPLFVSTVGYIIGMVL